MVWIACWSSSSFTINAPPPFPFVEQLFIRFGFFMYAKVVANLGTAEFAAHQVCMNVMTISFGIGDGLQVANTSLVGQSLGAKRPDLAIVQSRLTQLIGMCCAFVVFLIVSILLSIILATVFCCFL